MKTKSKKLARLEKNRYSIFTDNMEQCYICNRTAEDIHEVYGGGNRQISMINGFCLPLCREHHQQIHTDSKSALVLKKHCQKVYEETHSREEFIKLIGRSYL